jgi:hypothetical protein
VRQDTFPPLPLHFPTLSFKHQRKVWSLQVQVACVWFAGGGICLNNQSGFLFGFLSSVDSGLGACFFVFFTSWQLRLRRGQQFAHPVLSGHSSSSTEPSS